jgi:hypothetical protein
VKSTLRRQLRKRKRKLKKQIDKKRGFQNSRIEGENVKYELSEKQQATHVGGLGAMQQLIKQVGLRKLLNPAAAVLKQHAPYDETDHILNIAYNLLGGGTCLDHLELRRTDEAYLNALGVERIPDPTTAGDFCRRYSSDQLLKIMSAIGRSNCQLLCSGVVY